MRMRQTFGPFIALALIAGSGSAIAQDGAALYQTKACVSCHGPDGKSPVLPAYPKIAGQNAEYLFQQLKDIKSEARNSGMAAAMAGIMQNVNEDEMRAIADWLASQPRK